MSWRCKVENEPIDFSVRIALANIGDHGGEILHFAPVSVTDYRLGTEIEGTAWLSLPRDAAVALMLELQNVLAPDRRAVDREVLERCDEALAVERSRIDKILDRTPQVIVTDGSGVKCE